MNIHIKPDSSGFVWIHRILDSVVPLGLLFAIVVLLDYPWHERYLTMGLASGILFITAAQFTGIYTTWRGRPLYSSFKLILYTWGITWVSLIVLAFLVKESESYSRLITVTWAMTTPLSLITYRALIRYVLNKIRREGRNQKSVLIIGQGQVGERIANTFQQNPWMGYQVLGYLADEAQPNQHHTHYLGNIELAHGLVNQHKISEVYICLPIAQESKIKQILNDLTDTTAIVKYVPDLFSFDLMHTKWTEIQGIPVISVYDSPLSSGNAKFFKRTFDIAFSLITLLAISPLLAWIAYKVKQSSPGPIIFKQNRYGINGQEIKVYKFRSMTTQDNGDVIKQATTEDPRITPFGAFIRRTSLDELPQFLNVLQGRMSVVGPRPHAVAHNEEYRKLIPQYMQRHLVKPGITGWAQTNGWRGETETLDKMEKRIEFDIHYINSWSLSLDVKIIISTLLKGFSGTNAK